MNIGKSNPPISGLGTNTNPLASFACWPGGPMLHIAGYAGVYPVKWLFVGEVFAVVFPLEQLSG